jgi:hypothetical protein
MNREVRITGFVLIAVVTGMLIQCSDPVIQHILDAGIDGSIFDSGLFDGSTGDSGIRDARADIDIPEGCKL